MKKFKLKEIKFIEEGDTLEEVSDGFSGAQLYFVIKKNEKYFLKIFNEKFDFNKIDILKKQLEIYKKLNIKSIEIIDFGKIENPEEYYIVYNYIDGQNLKRITDSKEYNLQYIRNLGRKIGKQLSKLREYNQYDKELFEFKDINKLTENIINNFNLMLKDEKVLMLMHKYFDNDKLKKLENKLKENIKVFRNIEPKLIHGDVKRANVMVDKNGELYMVDVESMQLNYDVMNFLYQMTWLLFKENRKEAEFVRGYFDGIYNNKRPDNFNEQIIFMAILNFFNESYHMYSESDMKELDRYTKKCNDLFNRINNINL